MAEGLMIAANFLKDYGTLIAIPAAAVVGSVTYRLQKSVDRKSALIELRRKAYVGYLETLFSLISNINEENNRAYNLKLIELSAVASDEVVRKIGNIRNIFSEGSSRQATASNTESIRIIGEVVLSMRKDCFELSDLSIQEIYEAMPIRFKK